MTENSNQIANVAIDAVQRCLHIDWRDGHLSTFHFVWLHIASK